MITKQILSIVTLACFLVSFVFGDVVHASLNTKPSVSETSCLKLEDQIIPQSFGRITDFYEGRGTKDDGRNDSASLVSRPSSFVINIQDLHCHPEVQRNISKIIQSLDEKYNLKNIYVEGGYGTVDTSWLCNLKDEILKKEITENLLKQGLLAGSEYYSVLSNRPRFLEGIEEEGLHKSNVVRLGRLLERKPFYENKLNIFEKQIEFMKTKYLNSENRKFNKTARKYRTGKISAEKYFNLLKVYADKINSNTEKYDTTLSVDMDDYNNIKTYVELNELSKKLNYKKITAQMQEFIKLVKTRLPYRVYSSLLEKTDNFTKTDLLYMYLSVLSKKEPFTLNPSLFTDLCRFFDYTEKSRKINPIEMINEEKRLEGEIRMGLSKDITEYEVSFLSDFFVYFKDYMLTSISADDYKYFNSKFDKFCSLWNKYSQDDMISELKNDFNLMSKYYETNCKRNESFLENMDVLGARCMVPGKGNNVQSTDVDTLHPAPGTLHDILKASQIVVMVTGGFHSDGLKELFKNRGIAYITITPNATQGVEESTRTYEEIAKYYAKVCSNSIYPGFVSQMSLAGRIKYELEAVKENEIIDTLKKIEVSYGIKLNKLLTNIEKGRIVFENGIYIKLKKSKNEKKNAVKIISEAFNSSEKSLENTKNVVYAVGSGLAGNIDSAMNLAKEFGQKHVLQNNMIYNVLNYMHDAISSNIAPIMVPETSTIDKIGYAIKSDPNERIEQIELILSEIDKELANPGDGQLPSIINISDIHGDINRFTSLLSHGISQMCGSNINIEPSKWRNYEEHLYGLPIKNMKGSILINGDFLDRGPNGIKCVMLAKALKKLFPDKVFINLGNHDLWAVGNLLELHLPWYEGFDFHGDEETKTLVEGQRNIQPENVNDFLWWTARLAEYNKEMNDFEKNYKAAVEAKSRREEFVGYQKQYMSGWNTEQQEAWEDLTGNFARIKVSDAYVGLNGAGKTSVVWWQDLLRKLQKGREARGDIGADAAELDAWDKAVSIAELLLDANTKKSLSAVSEGKWWNRVFESINTNAYVTPEWWFKDWSSHKGWGEETIKELNKMGFEQFEVTQSNYPESAIMQEIARFYKEETRLFYKDPYGNIVTHGWFPVDENGDVEVKYKGQKYKNQSIFTSLNEMSDVLSNPQSKRSQLMEVLSVVNDWYADKSTVIKPDNVKKYTKSFGIAKILSNLATANWITGHNTLDKLDSPLILEGDYAKFEIDAMMAEKFGGIGAYLIIGPRGAEYYGFNVKEKKDISDIAKAPLVKILIKDKEKVINHEGLPAEVFLVNVKKSLIKEMKELEKQIGIKSNFELNFQEHDIDNHIPSYELKAELPAADNFMAKTVTETNPIFKKNLLSLFVVFSILLVNNISFGEPGVEQIVPKPNYGIELSNPNVLKYLVQKTKHISDNIETDSMLASRIFKALKADRSLIDKLLQNDEQLKVLFAKSFKLYDDLEKGTGGVRFAEFWSKLIDIVEAAKLSKEQKTGFGSLVFDYFCADAGIEMILDKYNIGTKNERAKLHERIYNMLSGRPTSDFTKTGSYYGVRGEPFIDFGQRKGQPLYIESSNIFEALSILEHEVTHALGKDEQLKKKKMGYMYDQSLFAAKTRYFTKMMLNWLKYKTTESILKGNNIYKTDETLLVKYANIFNTSEEMDGYKIDPKKVNRWQDVTNILIERQAKKGEVYVSGTAWAKYLLELGINYGDFHVPEVTAKLMQKKGYLYHPFKAESIACASVIFYNSYYVVTTENIKNSILKETPSANPDIVNKWAEHYVRSWAEGMLANQENTDSILRKVIAERKRIAVSAVSEKDLLEAVRGDVDKAAQLLTNGLKKYWESEVLDNEIKNVIPNDYIETGIQKSTSIIFIKEIIKQHLKTKTRPPLYVENFNNKVQDSEIQSSAVQSAVLSALNIELKQFLELSGITAEMDLAVEIAKLFIGKDDSDVVKENKHAGDFKDLFAGQLDVPAKKVELVVSKSDKMFKLDEHGKACGIPLFVIKTGDDYEVYVQEDYLNGLYELTDKEKEEFREKYGDLSPPEVLVGEEVTELSAITEIMNEASAKSSPISLAKALDQYHQTNPQAHREFFKNLAEKILIQKQNNYISPSNEVEGINKNVEFKNQNLLSEQEKDAEIFVKNNKDLKKIAVEFQFLTDKYGYLPWQRIYESIGQDDMFSFSFSGLPVLREFTKDELMEYWPTFVEQSLLLENDVYLYFKYFLPVIKGTLTKKQNLSNMEDVIAQTKKSAGKNTRFVLEYGLPKIYEICGSDFVKYLPDIARAVGPDLHYSEIYKMFNKEVELRKYIEIIRLMNEEGKTFEEARLNHKIHNKNKPVENMTYDDNDVNYIPKSLDMSDIEESGGYILNLVYKELGNIPDNNESKYIRSVNSIVRTQYRPKKNIGYEWERKCTEYVKKFCFLYDIDGVFEGKYLEDAKKVLKNMPEDILDTINDQDKNILLKNHCLAILVILKHKIGPLLTKKKYNMILDKIVYVACFENGSDNAYSTLRIGEELCKKINLTSVYIGVLSHEITHNIHPKNMESGEMEFMADLGSLTVLSELGLNNNKYKSFCMYKDCIEKKANVPFVYEEGGSQKAARAQIQWIEDSLTKARLEVKWDKLLKIALKTSNKNNTSNFRNIVKNTVLQYKSELGMNNSLIVENSLNTLNEFIAVFSFLRTSMLTPIELDLLLEYENINQEQRFKSILEIMKILNLKNSLIYNLLNESVNFADKYGRIFGVHGLIIVGNYKKSDNLRNKANNTDLVEQVKSQIRPHLGSPDIGVTFDRVFQYEPAVKKGSLNSLIWAIHIYFGDTPLNDLSMLLFECNRIFKNSNDLVSPKINELISYIRKSRPVEIDRYLNEAGKIDVVENNDNIAKNIVRITLELREEHVNNIDKVIENVKDLTKGNEEAEVLSEILQSFRNRVIKFYDTLGEQAAKLNIYEKPDKKTIGALLANLIKGKKNSASKYREEINFEELYSFLSTAFGDELYRGIEKFRPFRFEQWVFDRETMGFGNIERNWWNGGVRAKTLGGVYVHPGIDLAKYIDKDGNVQSIASNEMVPAFLDGEIKWKFRDFLGQSVFVQTSVKHGEYRVFCRYSHVLANPWKNNYTKVIQGDVVGLIPEQKKSSIVPPHLDFGMCLIKESAFNEIEKMININKGEVDISELNELVDNGEIIYFDPLSCIKINVSDELFSQGLVTSSEPALHLMSMKEYKNDINESIRKGHIYVDDKYQAREMESYSHFKFKRSAEEEILDLFYSIGDRNARYHDNSGLNSANTRTMKNNLVDLEYLFEYVLDSAENGSQIKVLDVGAGAGFMCSQMSDIAKKAKKNTVIDSIGLVPFDPYWKFNLSFEQIKKCIKHSNSYHKDYLGDFDEKSKVIPLDIVFKLNNIGYKLMEYSSIPFVRKQYIGKLNRIYRVIDVKYKLILDSYGGFTYTTKYGHPIEAVNAIASLLDTDGLFISIAYDLKDLNPIIIPENIAVIYSDTRRWLLIIRKDGAQYKKMRSLLTPAANGIYHTTALLSDVFKINNPEIFKSPVKPFEEYLPSAENSRKYELKTTSNNKLYSFAFLASAMTIWQFLLGYTGSWGIDIVAPKGIYFAGITLFLAKTSVLLSLDKEKIKNKFILVYKQLKDIFYNAPRPVRLVSHVTRSENLEGIVKNLSNSDELTHIIFTEFAGNNGKLLYSAGTVDFKRKKISVYCRILSGKLVFYMDLINAGVSSSLSDEALRTVTAKLLSRLAGTDNLSGEKKYQVFMRKMLKSVLSKNNQISDFKSVMVMDYTKDTNETKKEFSKAGINKAVFISWDTNKLNRFSGKGLNNEIEKVLIKNAAMSLTMIENKLLKLDIEDISGFKKVLNVFNAVGNGQMLVEWKIFEEALRSEKITEAKTKKLIENARKHGVSVFCEHTASGKNEEVNILKLGFAGIISPEKYAPVDVRAIRSPIFKPGEMILDITIPADVSKEQLIEIFSGPGLRLSNTMIFHSRDVIRLKNAARDVLDKKAIESFFNILINFGESEITSEKMARMLAYNWDAADIFKNVSEKSLDAILRGDTKWLSEAIKEQINELRQEFRGAFLKAVAERMLIAERLGGINEKMAKDYASGKFRLKDKIHEEILGQVLLMRYEQSKTMTADQISEYEDLASNITPSGTENYYDFVSRIYNQILDGSAQPGSLTAIINMLIDDVSKDYNSGELLNMKYGTMDKKAVSLILGAA